MAYAQRSTRLNIKSDPRHIELIWISRNGSVDTNAEALVASSAASRFFIQRVRANGSQSYWATEEIAASQQYAIDRATSLGLTHKKSYRVSRLMNATEQAAADAVRAHAAKVQERIIQAAHREAAKAKKKNYRSR